MADRDWVHHGNMRVLEQAHENGNKFAPYDALEYLRIEKKRIVPTWILDAIVADYQQRRHPREIFDKGQERPKKATKQWRPEQRLIDAQCYTFVKMFRAEGKRLGVPVTFERAYKAAYIHLGKFHAGLTLSGVHHSYVRAAKLDKQGKLYLS